MNAGKSFVLLLQFLLVPTLFSSIELEKVSFRYYNKNQLTRLPEYFTGKEYSGNRLFFRTSDNRGGFYFILSSNQLILKSSAISKVEISVIQSGSMKHELFSFNLPGSRLEKKELLFGITGKNWVSDKIKPIAWKIECKDSLGKTLYFKNSFLWEHD